MTAIAAIWIIGAITIIVISYCRSKVSHRSAEIEETELDRLRRSGL